MDGPPKSTPPFGVAVSFLLFFVAASFLLFFVFGYLAFKSTRYIGFLIFRNQPKPGWAWRGEIRGQRRPREWFAEIQPLAFASAASFCCFLFLATWPLSLQDMEV